MAGCHQFAGIGCQLPMVTNKTPDAICPPWSVQCEAVQYTRRGTVVGFVGTDTHNGHVQCLYGCQLALTTVSLW